MTNGRGETFFVGKDVAMAHARMGLAKSRTHSRRNRLGIWHTKRYLVWTEKGRMFLYDFFNHQNR